MSKSKSKHSEAQIIAALKQVEAGRAVEDLAREYGVSQHTIYAWKSKYGGMEVSEAQEVKQLREENARLKRLVAEAKARRPAGRIFSGKRVRLAGTCWSICSCWP
jgi:putative transposase